MAKNAPAVEGPRTRKPVPTQDTLRKSVQSVVDAAERRGIPIREISVPAQRVELGTGAYQQRYWGLSASTDGDHGVKIAHDKYQAKKRMAAAGLPTPAGHTVSTVDKALTRASAIGYPVVLKPRGGNKGQDVYVDIETAEELRRVWALLSRSDPRDGILIEQFVPGEEYRVLVIGGKVAAVNHRIPPLVVGDGTSTIRQLVDRENARPERGPQGTGSALCLIIVDDQTDEVLAKTGRSLDTILPAGECQLVRRTSNASGGGSTAEVTARMHPDNAFICETAARICELTIAGVDFIAPDIARSVVETGGGVIEVNSSPGLHDHFLPGSGRPIDAGAAIVDALYPPGSPVRATLVLVIGGDAAIAQAIDTAFTERGADTGVAADGEVRVRGVRLAARRTSPSPDPGPLLHNPHVEIAIVHCNPANDDLDPGLLPYVDVVVLEEARAVDAAVLASVLNPDRGWVIVGEAELENAILLGAGASNLQIAQAVVALVASVDPRERATSRASGAAPRAQSPRKREAAHRATGSTARRR